MEGGGGVVGLGGGEGGGGGLEGGLRGSQSSWFLDEISTPATCYDINIWSPEATISIG